MRTSPKRATNAHHRRPKQRDLVRLELRVHKDDIALVRSVVEALSDPDRGADARALLRARFGPPRKGLKALLAAAPLEAIDLERDRDVER